MSDVSERGSIGNLLSGCKKKKGSRRSARARGERRLVERERERTRKDDVLLVNEDSVSPRTEESDIEVIDGESSVGKSNELAEKGRKDELRFASRARMKYLRLTLG